MLEGTLAEVRWIYPKGSGIGPATALALLGWAGTSTTWKGDAPVRLDPTPSQERFLLNAK